MILIIGLGNPGKKYQNTRHNIGFQAIDEIAKENDFSLFKFSKKGNALLSQGKIGNKKIILAKPQTFMNKSGIAVKNLACYYKVAPSEIWVIHDDIDLIFGKIKIQKNRGSAGHKGVQSIFNEIKTKNFIRFRIGIKQNAQELKNVEKFVLKKFEKKEEETLQKIIKKIKEIIGFSLKQGIEKAMSEFN
ncbi:MAG: aminoacyl-tRNA hydrolase [Patescibacteria group bacterium]|nr:aminoacyl-tRNA hydrolase [Patescibacteria group bacterium]